jgi:hypothetical protein
VNGVPDMRPDREGRSRPGFLGQVLNVLKQEKSIDVRITIVREFMKNKKLQKDMVEYLLNQDSISSQL